MLMFDLLVLCMSPTYFFLLNPQLKFDLFLKQFTHYIENLKKKKKNWLNFLYLFIYLYIVTITVLMHYCFH